MTTIVLISDLTFENYEQQAGPWRRDIVVTDVVEISRFWINVRSTDILGARKKVIWTCFISWRGRICMGRRMEVWLLPPHIIRRGSTE